MGLLHIAMKYRRFEELPVWQDSAGLARAMYEFTSIEPLRRHPGLRDQLERAALSISNNIAEGFERGSTSELLAFLFIARGSAGEVRSMLLVIEGWPTLDDFKSQISDLKNRSENISRQLYGWIEKLKESDISGQRHLDEKARTRYAGKRDREEFLEQIRRINEEAAEERRKSRKPESES
jgi:four helix bundle protein